MKQLRVLLVCRDSGRSREGRMVGAWSYPVPEFTWDTYCVPKVFSLDLAGFYGAYDLVMHEDTKAWGSFEGNHRKLPVAYIVRDSTLSDDHYEQRVRQSRNHADLVLVDWDTIERFLPTHKPVHRLSHCANDRLFKDYGEEKTVDIAFHCAVKGCPGRSALRDWLHEYCAARGLVYASGIRPYEEYARAMNRAKVTVHLERTPTTRAHRVFDAMACRTCLLTSPLPAVSGEERQAGVHYVEWRDGDELERELDRLLAGEWRRYADAGYELVMKRHTWAVRARELRRLIPEVFPWLA